MTSPSETIAKALAKVELREWFAGGVTDEGLTVIDDGLSHGIFPIKAETHEANFIAACNPVAMREVLDELYALRETALQLEAMKREMAEKDERIVALGAGLKPFVNAFERRREAYSKRYGDRQELGYANFDKMPDAWDMETISFTMGAFRRARALIQGDEKCTAI